MSKFVILIIGQGNSFHLIIHSDTARTVKDLESVLEEMGFKKPGCEWINEREEMVTISGHGFKISAGSKAVITLSYPYTKPK